MSSLAEFAARQEIADVLVRYCTGIDRRDWELFRSCFADDVVAEYDGIATWTDVDQITEFMRSSHTGLGHTLHRLSNIAVAVGDGTATARSYVDAVLMSTDGASGVSAIGFYDDELALVAGGWRIRRRHYTMVRLQHLAATPGTTTVSDDDGQATTVPNTSPMP